MKEIKNLEDLRYRKLYLRSEIKLKEQKLDIQYQELKEELNSTDFKNEIVRSAINNPAFVINVARITYNLIVRFRKRKRKKATKRNLKNKN